MGVFGDFFSDDESMLTTTTIAPLACALRREEVSKLTETRPEEEKVGAKPCQNLVHALACS